MTSSPLTPGPHGPVRGWRRPLAAITCAAAMAGGLLIPLQSAAARPADPAPAADGDHARTTDVTLLTGDVVHYTDGPGTNDTITVDRAEGATGAVQVQQFGDEYYVVPDEAAPLIANGTVDRRLFDVTGLIRMGYDDAHTDGLPVIATYDTRTRSVPTAPSGSALTHRLDSIHGAALTVKDSGHRAFWNSVTGTSGKARTLTAGLAKLWLDGQVKASLKDSVPQINAPAAWAEGYDGAGVKVAVLDTGIDPTHPDVKDRIVGSKSFVPGEEVLDGHGHGTHVASTVAGSGAASDGVYKGVAPAADLLIGKVLGNTGTGQNSAIIEAMEWAKDQGAEVVSMSLGESVPDDGTDPMALAVDALSADGGPLFVIAAGNAYDPGSISSPGSADKALTVAAVDSRDRRAPFSSQGPLTGSYGLKPDISAPGVDITAAASQAVPGTTGMYRTMSGTSMATPHVAGAAAILKQRHPDWTGQQLKDALMSTSKELTDSTPYELGTGRVDVAAAVDTEITATGSVAAAAYDWPHSAGDPVAERTISYVNHGDHAVTLDLATDTSDEACTLSAGTLTVPAGGTAQAVLSLDPAKAEAGTSLSGQVNARDHATGTVVAHTGFALAKERELYDLTLELRGQDGKPAQGNVLVAPLGSDSPETYAVSGSRTLRLPPGNYVVWSLLDVPGDRSDSKAWAYLVDPETELHADTTVTLDASKARKVSAKTPKPAETRQTRFEMVRTAADGTVMRDAITLPVTVDQLWVSPTRKVTEGDFEFCTRWNLQEPRTSYRTTRGSEAAVLQGGSAQPTGTFTRRTAYAGDGAPADYANLDVRDRTVIVDRSDAVTPADRLANAEAAGAKGLLVINDGPGVLWERYSSGTTTIPVASVHRSQGPELLAADRRGKKLVMDNRGAPRYLYDLVSRHAGVVPDRSLSYEPDPRHDLAEVQNRFYSDRATSGHGYRYDIPAYGAGIGFDIEETYPMVRTEWVDQLSGGATWFEDHTMNDSRGTQVLSGGGLTYRGGEHRTTDWFAPVQRPAVGSAYAGPFRDANNTLSLAVTPYADAGSRDRAGIMESGDTTRTALYQGDTLVAQSASRAVRAGGRPAETLPYRLVMDSARSAQDWHTSVRSHSEWGFASGAVAGPAREDVKLLQPYYGVDTDLAGNARAGHRLTLTLSAATQEWLATRTYADSATLSVSYDDGSTWRPTVLRRTGRGTWSTQLTPPKKQGGAVSLKATAKGSGGLTVEQEVIRAFGLG
ncbi:S8 family serine peptidase [Streptomyces sp. NBC_01324]|uniref:S8 family peptidase n=1 Tax=Streptomyces sp. NBC_01324 TaxID=2903826 RepID=UPI002E0ECBEF|nr:S8 family serine peptidase [Streptomyces sp. NBC_01324]